MRPAHPLLNNITQDHESAVMTDFADGSQMSDRWRRHYMKPRIDSPEKLLQFALIQDALTLIVQVNWKGGNPYKKKTGVDCQERAAIRAAQEARHWIEDLGRQDFGSFCFAWSTVYPEYSATKAAQEILTNPEEIRGRLKLKNVRNQYSGPQEKSDDEC